MFEVGAVVERAGKALVAASNMPAEARQVYEGAILEWTDAYGEGLQDSASAEAQSAKRAIAQLWMEYARMERNLRQWKQAVTVFENALADDVVNDVAELWIDYANFYDIERQKPAKAQKVYIRALPAVSAQERPRIWDAFLRSMRQTTPDLTLEQLKTAVQSQYKEPPEEANASTSAHTPAPVPAPVSATTATTTATAAAVVKREAPTAHSSLDTPPTKRPYTESHVAHTGAGALTGTDTGFASQRQGISPAERPARIAQFLATYSERPPNLFLPSSSDSTRLKDLAAADRAAIEELFACDEDSRLLLLPPQQTIFEVVEALSMMQALKERTFDKWFADIQERQQARGRAMHMDHQEREARCPEVHRSDVRRANKEEYDAYVLECGMEVKLLHAVVWKEALGILQLQQRMLAELGLPHMAVTTDPVMIAKQREILNAIQLAHSDAKNEPVPSSAPIAAKTMPRRPAAAVPKRIPPSATTMASNAGPSAIAAGAVPVRTNGHAGQTIDPRQMRHPTAQQARDAMAAAAASATSGSGRAEDGGANTNAGQVNPESLPMLMKIAALLQQTKK